MLSVMGAMAALSIDVVSFYTARSEAQLAADGAALAGARVLANSGATSDTTGNSMAGAWTLAQAVATQVAVQNPVGGTTPTVTLPTSPGGTNTNPTVTVKVTATLPTFFARIWGTTQVTVTASATAEAYNPSGAFAISSTTAPPVAPLCVKPWLLPNIDPTQGSPTGNAIFGPTGGIVNSGLLNQQFIAPGLVSRCGDCSPGAGGIPSPMPAQYYPGSIADFPVPTVLPACSSGLTTSYQLAVAGCVPQPITCGASSSVAIDVSPYGTFRDTDTVAAASCLIHDYGTNLDADSMSTSSTNPPFEFVGGNQNPIAGAVGSNTLVSDSLVTIPVINNTNPASPPASVAIIGFLQVFLDRTGATMSGGTAVPATIINMAGCTGTSAGAQPVIGNGASPVAVRLVTPP